MSVNEDILDAITGHSVDLVRVEAGLRRKVVKDLKALESSVIKMLKNSGVAETISQKVKEKRLKKLLEQTRATIATSFKDISKESKKDLGSLANISAKQSVDAINGSLKASVASVGMSRSVLESISGNVLIEGAPSKEWWRRQSSQFQSEFSDVIRRGALLGKTTQEITKDFVGTQANNFKDGVAIRGRRRAEGLVRTSIQTVANEARQRTYAENEDIVKGIEWVSTLDSRTSTICKVLDGLVWDNNKKPIGHDKEYVGLTAHWNCRSTQVPILKSWEELGAKKKYGEIPTSTRASMDGQVSASINYEDWLKSKPESFQKTVLGLGKWGLWKNGSLGFTDLIDQSGNEITLNELSERYGGGDKVEDRLKYWADQPVEKVSFRGSTSSSSVKFDKHVKKLRPEAKRIINKLKKPDSIVRGDGFYVAEKHHISTPTSDHTFNHEYGHFIDHQLNKSGYVRGYISSDRLGDASKKDAKKLGLITDFDAKGDWRGHRKQQEVLLELKAKWSHKEKVFFTRGKKKGQYKWTINKSNEEYLGAMSDVIDSMTKGVFFDDYYMSGHGKEYYGYGIETKKGTRGFRSQQTENFANMFAIWSNDDRKGWNHAKKVFPNTTKEFEVIMVDVLDGKIDGEFDGKFS